jgi:hypothetical protein
VLDHQIDVLPSGLDERGSGACIAVQPRSPPHGQAQRSGFGKTEDAKPEEPKTDGPRTGPNTSDSDPPTGARPIAAIETSDLEQSQVQTSTQTLSPAPEVKATYVINSSTEFGWRFKSLDGNENECGSQFDYDRGMRMFGGSFVARPANRGSGPLFDSLLANSIGLGGARLQRTFGSPQRLHVQRRALLLLKAH